jgi:hypothetical protein
MSPQRSLAAQGSRGCLAPVLLNAELLSYVMLWIIKVARWMSAAAEDAASANTPPMLLTKPPCLLLTKPLCLLPTKPLCLLLTN